ncbi:putative low-specificity L-threonine aldolase like protein [Argiope bruennichi]|uniref:Putative low-specificity L-threonine aldolase like protein n=1 Tax=Argiope bruennichi TaxID=94029 RepID=A0A8T0EA05_ARGBR|nr:putative low-specificity L-threonine aldolase like protein [Argiope bruennichi]
MADFSTPYHSRDKKESGRRKKESVGNTGRLFRSVQFVSACQLSNMVREVDLRSDTVTKPTPAMRKAMAEAVVGDDVYKEDPTINELEEKIAEFLGKEAALFVASGTMGNLSAVMAHCWTRGQEIIMGDQSHMFMYEQGGISSLAGVHVSSIPTLEDGTFDLEVLKEKIRPRNPNMHEPSTGLICLENSHNRCGGKVLPLSYIREVCALARNNDIPVHMDGARIINASVHCGVPAHEIVKECASVSMCLSKGIGAPWGLLWRFQTFTKRELSLFSRIKNFFLMIQTFIVMLYKPHILTAFGVHRCRKVLGGAMRQAGVLAAAALVALESAEERIRIDHQRTKKFAQEIYNLKSKLITCDPAIDSNMILLQFPSPNFTNEDFVRRMAEVKIEDKEQVVVKACPWYRNRVRCVLHSDLTQEDLDSALMKIRAIANKQDPDAVVVKAGLRDKNRVRCVIHSDLNEEHLEWALQKIRKILG